MADKAEIGELRRRADGKLYRKEGPGKWVLADSPADRDQQVRKWASTGRDPKAGGFGGKKLSNAEKLKHLMSLSPADRAAWMQASKTRVSEAKTATTAIRDYGKNVRSLTREAKGLKAE